MAEILQSMGAQHITLPLKSKNPLVIFRNISKLRTIIRTYKVNVAHARSRGPAWSAFFACKKEKCAFITTVHGAYRTQNGFKKLYNSVMVRGDRFIAISEFIARYIKQTYGDLKGVHLDRLLIIPRGIDCKAFDPQAVSPTRTEALAKQWRLPQNTPLIILPARLSPSKGHRVLLKALSYLPHENFLCLFIGSDQGRSHYTASLQKDIRHLHLQDKVRITGNCQDMACAYKLTDIVINPSIVPEAFGRVIVEAQAMGKPVIASKLGAPSDLIVHGKTGWLVPASDAKSLALAIKSVLRLDEKAKKALALEARRHVERNYSNEIMCQKTLALYRQLLEEKYG